MACSLDSPGCRGGNDARRGDRRGDRDESGHRAWGRARAGARWVGGVICNVTSSSVLAPVPFYAPYRSSKAAVGAIGESLRAELAPFGIRVLDIMPGPIDTDMLTGSGEPPAAIEYDGYREMAQR